MALVFFVILSIALLAYGFVLAPDRYCDRVTKTLTTGGYRIDYKFDDGEQIRQMLLKAPFLKNGCKSIVCDVDAIIITMERATFHLKFTYTDNCGYYPLVTMTVDTKMPFYLKAEQYMLAERIFNYVLNEGTVKGLQDTSSNYRSFGAFAVAITEITLLMFVLRPIVIAVLGGVDAPIWAYVILLTVILIRMYVCRIRPNYLKSVVK